jgi:hypothetical protein
VGKRNGKERGKQGAKQQEKATEKSQVLCKEVELGACAI